MRKLTLSLAVMAALLPARGYPLGLGEIELDSALNQELNAEIEVLSAAPEDAEQLIVKLADRDAFSRAGLDRPFLLQQLKFKVVDKNGTPFVKVYTRTPVREPFLSFLVEIDWPQGHLLREYTLLLDPPVYNAAPTAATPASSESSHPFIEPADSQVQAQSVASQQQSAAPVQSSAQAAPAVQTAVITSDSGRSVSYQYQAQPLPQATSSSDQYRVQQNDTLWSMANRMRPDSSVSVEQMMLALVRKNPEAFIQENINGVKRGYILRIPNRDEATQLDRQQAVAQAREHAALWREYSQGAVSAAPASSMEAEESMDTAADQPRDADGHLSIVGASEQGSEESGSNQDPDAQLSRLKQDLAMAREQLESEKLEKEDLRSRLAELEQRVQRVIEMDDGELAQLQQELQQSRQVEEPAAEPVDEFTEEVLPEEPVIDESVEDEIVSDEMPVEEEFSEEAPVDESAEMAEEDAVFVDEIDAEEVADEFTETETQLDEPVQDIEPPVFAQKKPKGFLENLMDDPKLLGMIGGGLALVLLLVALLLKRIRGSKSEEDEWAEVMDGDEPSDLDDVTVQTTAADMDATAEMQSESAEDLGMEDTQIDAPSMDDTSLEDTVFSLDGAETEAVAEEVEQDDVLAEADVYLAYGIYQQAEELLTTAIDQNPERDDYRMKLLETHFAAKNSPAFEQLAQDVQSRKGEDKVYWDRVSAMGMELCPGNGMFTGGDSVISDFDAEAILPDKPQTTDLELDSGDEQGTDFDLGLDEELETDATQVLSEPLALDEEQPAEEVDSLDDMDLAGELESISSEAGEPEAEPLADDDTSSELEFDLGELDDDLGEMDIAEETAEEDSGDLDIDDDFSLDFDAADLGFEESEDEAEAEEVIAVSEELDLDADLDLGVDLEEAPAEESMEMGLGEDLGDIEIDSAELDMDMDAADIDLADEDLDVGDIELDVSTESADEIGMDLDAGLDLSADDDDFDISELSEDIDEVSTKLDLARAYIDMGDNDGARSILEEVKAEGNDEQQQQANELLQKAS